MLHDSWRPSARAGAAAISRGRCCRNTCPSSSWFKDRAVESRPAGARRRGARARRQLSPGRTRRSRRPASRAAMLPAAVRRRPGARRIWLRAARCCPTRWPRSSRPEGRRALRRDPRRRFRTHAAAPDARRAKLACRRRLRSALPWRRPRAKLEFDADAPVRRLGAEESNSVGRGRRAGAAQDLPARRSGHPPGARDGPVPDRVWRVRAHAAAPGLDRATSAAGWTADGIAGAFAFVANQGNGWQLTLDHLDRVLEEVRHTPEAKPAGGRSCCMSSISSWPASSAAAPPSCTALAIDTDGPCLRARAGDGGRSGGVAAAARTEVAARLRAHSSGYAAAPAGPRRPTSTRCWQCGRKWKRCAWPARGLAAGL